MAGLASLTYCCSVKSRLPLLCLLFACGIGGAVAQTPRPAKPSGLTNYFSGNTNRITNQPVGGPGIVLMGGGSEVDAAFTTYVYPIANGGDFVVLRTDNSRGYQSYLHTNLVAQLPSSQRVALKPNSVETLVVDSRAKAESAYVKWVVEGANCIFIAGGDQTEYVEFWRGTALDTAVRAAYARGAVVGGTSAGACVMGDYIYDPGTDPAATSATAISNPYRAGMVFSTDFWDFPPMRQTYVEPHFVTRDRMGRSLVMMGRLRQDETTENITTFCMDEGTSLFINAQGIATAQSESGTTAAYVLTESRRSTRRIQIAPGVPAIYRGLLRTKLTPGKQWNLNTGTNNGVTIPISVEGTTTLNPAGPY
jgi:cyanophycinase-like exopeptidase